MTKFQRIALPVLLLGLGLGFWRSEAFLTVAAGVAVFLFGMMSLERGFQSLSGGWMEHWLQRLTNSTGKSVSLGVVSTSLMQSSSLISLLSISFLSAGLISLSSGLAIIFGANLGTTSGAWLIAGFGLKVNLSDLALPLLVFGIVLQLQSRPSWRSLGHLLTGIGFLFLGIQFMKDGFSNLQSQMQLTAMPFQGFTALLLFTGLGIIATVVMQSSHATLILILTALAHQQIHYEDALAVAIGANIGTTVTAILGSISANAAGKRLALGHVVFNLVTGLVALLALPILIPVVELLGNGLGIAADNYTLRLALFHTVFNTLGVAIMLPQLERLTKWLEKRIPADTISIKIPRYLNDAALESALATTSVTRQESQRLTRHALDIVLRALDWEPRSSHTESLLPPAKEFTEKQIDDAYHNRIKTLYNAIVRFISLAHKTPGTTELEPLRQFRSATYHMVEAVKTSGQLHGNLYPALHGRHHTLHAAYEALRQDIRQVITLLENIIAKSTNEPSAAASFFNDYLLELEHQKLRLDDAHERADSETERMIREHIVTPAQATSLMNDQGYARQIALSLINAGQALILAQLPQTSKAQTMIQLSDEDVTQVRQTLATDASEESSNEA